MNSCVNGRRPDALDGAVGASSERPSAGRAAASSLRGNQSAAPPAVQLNGRGGAQLEYRYCLMRRSKGGFRFKMQRIGSGRDSQAGSHDGQAHFFTAKRFNICGSTRPARGATRLNRPRPIFHVQLNEKRKLVVERLPVHSRKSASYVRRRCGSSRPRGAANRNWQNARGCAANRSAFVRSATRNLVRTSNSSRNQVARRLRGSSLIRAAQQTRSWQNAQGCAANRRCVRSQRHPAPSKASERRPFTNRTTCIAATQAQTRTRAR